MIKYLVLIERMNKHMNYWYFYSSISFQLKSLFCNKPRQIYFHAVFETLNWKERESYVGTETDFED